MTHVLRCSCGKQLRVRNELAGKRAQCPGCQKVHVVPAQPASGTSYQAGADARPVHTTPDDFAVDRPRYRNRGPESEDDRPASRSSRSPVGYWIAAGAVLLLVGVGALVVALANGSKEPEKPGPRAPAPRPTIEVARAEPAEPKPGDTLVVELKGTSPSGEPLRYLFRTDPAGEWRPAPGPLVSLADLKEGMLNLEVRAENDRDGASDVLSRSWMVGAGEDDAVWEGGVLKLKKVPPVTTDNQNRLVKRYRQQLQLSASSVWQGWPTDKALDANVETSWFSAQNDAAALGSRPWVQATFPQDVR